MRKATDTPKGYTGVIRKLKKLPCEICGWDLGPREHHHIDGRVGYDEYDLHKIIILCPNHHCLADYKKIPRTKLLKIVSVRNTRSLYRPLKPITG